MPTFTATVEVDFSDVADDLDYDVLIEEMETSLARSGKRLSVTPLPGNTVGDLTPAQYVERAYLAAKTLPNLPREVADLFWHVYGRAI